MLYWKEQTKLYDLVSKGDCIIIIAMLWCKGNKNNVLVGKCDSNVLGMLFWKGYKNECLSKDSTNIIARSLWKYTKNNVWLSIGDCNRITVLCWKLYKSIGYVKMSVI